MTQQRANAEQQKNARPRIKSGAGSEPVDGRRGAVRTAWTMAAIAFAVYALFILSGVLAQ